MSSIFGNFGSGDLAMSLLSRQRFRPLPYPASRGLKDLAQIIPEDGLPEAPFEYFKRITTLQADVRISRTLFRNALSGCLTMP